MASVDIFNILVLLKSLTSSCLTIGAPHRDSANRISDLTGFIAVRTYVRPFGSKSIGKWEIQSHFSLICTFREIIGIENTFSNTLTDLLTMVHGDKKFQRTSYTVIILVGSRLGSEIYVLSFRKKLLLIQD